MFNITSNQAIKIHKGDRSSIFTLFLNQGTKYEPKHYKFFPALSLLEVPEQLQVQIDSDIFYNKTKIDGFYDFEYNYLYDEKGKRIGALDWYLDKEIINLEDFGIISTGQPSVSDHIIAAQFRENVSEVYIYIVDINADLDEWLMKKTFFSNGEIMTEFADPRIGTLDEMTEVVDSDGNMLLKFDPEDTMYLETGEYCYQIRAKLYDIKNDEYIFNTVTKRLPFYVVDGEDSMVW